MRFISHFPNFAQGALMVVFGFFLLSRAADSASIGGIALFVLLGSFSAACGALVLCLVRKDITGPPG